MSAETIDHNTFNKWFQEQVELALKEADDPATIWIPHAIVKTNMQRQRENLLSRIGIVQK